MTLDELNALVLERSIAAGPAAVRALIEEHANRRAEAATIALRAEVERLRAEVATHELERQAWGEMLQSPVGAPSWKMGSVNVKVADIIQENTRLRAEVAELKRSNAAYQSGMDAFMEATDAGAHRHVLDYKQRAEAVTAVARGLVEVAERWRDAAFDLNAEHMTLFEDTHAALARAGEVLK